MFNETVKLTAGCVVAVTSPLMPVAGHVPAEVVVVGKSVEVPRSMNDAWTFELNVCDVETMEACAEITVTRYEYEVTEIGTLRTV